MEVSGNLENWIEKLKVGDKVFVNTGSAIILATVDGITPAGYIKVNGALFYRNGWQRGGWDWYRPFLTEATPERIKGFYGELTIKKALAVMRETKDLSVDQAKMILHLLNADMGGEEVG